MRNKILTFLLICSIILSCGLILTACDGDSPKKYKITLEQLTGGTINASLDDSVDAKTIIEAEAGVKVYLSYNEDKNYKFVHFNVNGEWLDKNYFTMPNKDIKIFAVFNYYKPDDGSDSDEGDNLEKVNINYHVDEFTTNPNPQTIEVGQNYILKNPTKEGYAFVNWFLFKTGEMYLHEKYQLNYSNPCSINLYPKFEPLFKVSQDGSLIEGLTSEGEKYRSIIIPESIDGKDITGISSNAFKDNANMTQLKFGTNIKSIGENAFLGIDNLTKVTFTGKLSDWINIDFANFASTPLTRNTGSIADLKTIKTSLVIDNQLVEDTLTLSSDVKTIKSYAFRGFTFINKFDFKGTMEEYIKVQFGNSLSNPAVYGKLHINGNALSGVLDLSSYKINYIQPSAFYYCNKITKVILPKTVKFIGESAFYRCYSLSEINLAEIVYIYDDAFYKCNSIKSLSLNKIQKIGDGAFSESSELTSVNLGLYVNDIGDKAFFDCTKLKDVIINNPTHKINRIGVLAFSYTAIENIDLDCIIDKVETGAFRATKIKSFTITKYIKEFDMDALYDISSLHEIIIESESVYNSISKLPGFTGSMNIKVAVNIVNNSPNNDFLNNENNFSKTLVGDYYVFTKI